VQAVLPGATRTEFWDTSGIPVDGLPQDMVMSAEDMVDAALVGLDIGEQITIPSLLDPADWDRLEVARASLALHLSRSQPAERYKRSVRAASEKEVIRAIRSNMPHSTSPNDG
jgi:uncharacterized protein